MIHMTIRRIFAALLALMTLMGAAALAEEDFSFDFGDEGYTGQWLDIPALGVELCLPDGWSPIESEEDSAFEAVTNDGSATLLVYAVADEVQDIVAWADANLDGYQLDNAGFFDTLLQEEEDAVTVYRLNGEGEVLAFAFTRASAEALSTAFALEIVDSVNESWVDEGEPLDGDADLLAEIEAMEALDD